jgi:hypothetical protein
MEALVNQTENKSIDLVAQMDGRFQKIISILGQLVHYNENLCSIPLAKEAHLGLLWFVYT